jgi:hypothetical protein
LTILRLIRLPFFRSATPVQRFLHFIHSISSRCAHIKGNPVSKAGATIYVCHFTSNNYAMAKNLPDSFLAIPDFPQRMKEAGARHKKGGSHTRRRPKFEGSLKDDCPGANLRHNFADI